MNDFLRKLMQGYYNVTPPQTFDGRRMPSYRDSIPDNNTMKALQGYYNITPPRNIQGEVMPHYSRAILKDRTRELPENFLTPEQKVRYFLSQNLSGLGQKLGKVEKKPTLLDLLRNRINNFNTY